MYSVALAPGFVEGVSRYIEEADQEFQEHVGYFDGVSRNVAGRFVDDVEAAGRYRAFGVTVIVPF